MTYKASFFKSSRETLLCSGYLSLGRTVWSFRPFKRPFVQMFTNTGIHLLIITCELNIHIAIFRVVCGDKSFEESARSYLKIFKCQIFTLSTRRTSTLSLPRSNLSSLTRDKRSMLTTSPKHRRRERWSACFRFRMRPLLYLLSYNLYSAVTLFDKFISDTQEDRLHIRS